MSFWGQIVKPGVPAKLKSNGAFTTVLKQAALASDAKGKEASVLSVSVGSADKFVLCHLSPGKVEQWTIDLGFNAEDEVSFHLSGSAPVHLTGFYEDEDDEEDFDDEDIDDDDDLDDDDDDEPPLAAAKPPPAKKAAAKPKGAAMMGVDDEDDDDDDDMAMDDDE